MNKVFIYGSCTTRDSVHLWEEYSLQLSGYTARQSLISAMAGGSTNGFDLSGIASSFQKRMVLNDLRGSALQETLLATKSGDFVFWDLTDERNGTYELSDGRIITAVAFSTNGLRHSVSTHKKVRFATPEFRTSWLAAAHRFSDILGEHRTRVIVNATPWAVANEDGTKTPQSYPPAEEFNTELAWMARSLSALGFSVISPADDQVFGDPLHQWGPAPFHFAERTYRSMCEQFRTTIDNLTK